MSCVGDDPFACSTDHIRQFLVNHLCNTTTNTIANQRLIDPISILFLRESLAAIIYLRITRFMEGGPGWSSGWMAEVPKYGGEVRGSNLSMNCLKIMSLITKTPLILKGIAILILSFFKQMVHLNEYLFFWVDRFITNTRVHAPKSCIPVPV